MPMRRAPLRRHRRVRHRRRVRDQRFDAAEALGERVQPDARSAAAAPPRATRARTRACRRSRASAASPARAADASAARGSRRAAPSGARSGTRRAPGRWRCAAASAAPASWCRAARATNRTGPGSRLRRSARTAASSMSSSRTAMTMPPTLSLWPLRYLVVLWVDEVGAELDRPLDVGAGERVVDDQPDVVAVREVGRGAQVGDPHHRVGRRLDEQHPRRRRHRALDLVELRRVDVAERQLIARQHLVEQPERAAVGVVGDDDVIAGLQHRGDRADRRHARREREPRLAALRSPRGCARAPCASGSACGRTRSPCACRAPPARRSTSGRSA